MSAPLSRSSSPIPGRLTTTWQDERQQPWDAFVTDHGQFRGSSRTKERPAARILRNLGFTSDELRETIEIEITQRSAVRAKK
ncbi:Clp protease N-terminal domain-containing protein [Streptomyces sp. NPDC060027]|uniref:Clp protease N-terminal domain-containing protein n=1 Tax=Streptomyces sp. NPDC060027 TaxID=3347040 RepID=UPI003679FCD1